MKLSSIRIEKFRAIRSSAVRVGTELAFVGQNSSGKSSILRALNAFFNFSDEAAAFEAGSHCFQKSARSEIEVLFTDVPATCTLPRTSAGGTEVKARSRYKKAAAWQIFANGNWQRAPDNLHDELNKHVRYVYVPQRRDHSVSEWGDTGLLQKAVEAWVRHHTRNRDGFSPKVAKIASVIKRRAFSGLSTELRKVTPIEGNFSFELEYSTAPDYRLLLRDLVLRVSEGTTKVGLRDCGSGTQSMTAFALYSYLAGLEGSTYILGIEEPEQNLHPQAQRALLKNLRSMPLQVLFTTHSTVMLDELDHGEVVLCRRIESSTRGVEVTTTQISPGFWASHALDRDRYYQFYRRRNSEFFFANYVILVESPVDAEILRELLRSAGADHTEYGVSVLSLDGVQALPYAYRLLTALNLDFATVVDKDYFLPYINDALDTSRDTRGFPKYKKQFATGTLLDDMLPAPADRTALLDKLHSNHSRAMDLLEPVGVFCFRWSLEVDLVTSEKARNLLFTDLGVPAADQTTTALLVARKKRLKKLEVLLPVVKALPTKNLPHSYKRLRKVLPTRIKKAAALR